MQTIEATESTATPTIRSAWLVAAALGTVYLVWGSTYLAIRVGIETIPPIALAAARFILAGGVLFALTARRGAAADPIGWRQWRDAFIVGGLLLAGGNGLVSWAEQTVPTGLAALMIASTPLWMALFGRLLLGDRLGAVAGIGLVVGFSGVALLVRPGGSGANAGGIVALLLASLSWGFGSVWSRRAALPRRPLVAAGMEMLAAGALLLVISVASGEPGRLDPGAVSAASLWALAYLIVCGSLLAFTAYVWLLGGHAPLSLVSTYAYVNPLVAVALGVGFLDEVLTTPTVVGGGVVISAVALIMWAKTRGQPSLKPVRVGETQRPSARGKRRK